MGENPGEKYSHISPEKLEKITKDCDAMNQWLADMQAQQAKLAKHEKPVLICADMEKKNQELAKTADEILREPKPKPPEAPKEEKKADVEGTAPADDAAKGDAPKEDAPKGDAPKDGGVLDVDCSIHLVFDGIVALFFASQYGGHLTRYDI